MRKLIGILAFVLFLIGGAGAEVKIVSGKTNELPLELKDVIQDMPETVPQIEYVDGHFVISGLKAWGADEKTLGAYSYYRSGEFVRDPEHSSDDQLIIYASRGNIEEFQVDLAFCKGKLKGHLFIKPQSETNPSDSLCLRISEKKKNGTFADIYSDGTVTVYRGDFVICGEYQNGILNSGQYEINSRNKTVQYWFRNCGFVNGEYLFELEQLDVETEEGKNRRFHHWHPTSGWEDPEDKAVAGIALEKYPFTIKSTGIPCRVLPAVSSAPAAVAEDLSGLESALKRCRVFRTQQEMGFPALPEYSVEETDEGPILHMTGLSRWGMTEDEADFSSEDDYILARFPEGGFIDRIYVYLDDRWPDHSMPLVDIRLNNNAIIFCRYDYYGENSLTEIEVYQLWASLRYEFYFRNGYLDHYDDITTHRYSFRPVFSISPSTYAEDLKPDFRWTEFVSDNDGWRLSNGTWYRCGPQGIEEPLPLPEEAERDFPPVLEY